MRAKFGLNACTDGGMGVWAEHARLQDKPTGQSLGILLARSLIRMTLQIMLVRSVSSARLAVLAALSSASSTASSTASVHLTTTIHQYRRQR